MTKFGLVGRSKSLAQELGQHDIRVNSINPGVVKTDMTGDSPEELESEASLHPLVLGEPDDVTSAALYLASDAARWVTGTEFCVDGELVTRV